MKHLIYVQKDEMVAELDWYVGIKETHLYRYYEPEPGIFLCESKKVMQIALDCGYEPLHVVCTDKMVEDEILNQVGEVPIHVLSSKEASRRFGYVFTGGISCAMRRKKLPEMTDVLKDSKRIVVLENVENPTNLGAIFRSAAALGIDAILLSPACTDPLYRRALRVSMGTTLRIPWTFVCGTEEEWQEKGIDLLRAEGFTTVAMALRDDTIPIHDPVLGQKEKIALILGNEGDGLCRQSIEGSDYVAKIPMKNQVDSLNVSAAAAIAMWEILRDYNQDTDVSLR